MCRSVESTELVDRQRTPRGEHRFRARAIVSTAYKTNTKERTIRKEDPKWEVREPCHAGGIAFAAEMVVRGMRSRHAPDADDGVVRTCQCSPPSDPSVALKITSPREVTPPGLEHRKLVGVPT